ncbi:MAG: hypothetical protein SchgKO_02740 [Schleiferiaceae bacterium]
MAIPDHYLFKTAALDLGMFNHALYDFSHFRLNYFTTGIYNLNQNYLSDHFSPITILLSPLWYIGGSYTLLFVQVLAFVKGGLGVYRIAQFKKLKQLNQIGLLLAYFLMWPIYPALGFDFHTNSLAAVFAIWTYYYFLKGNRKLVLSGIILLLMCKETTPLWVAAAIFGLGMDFKNLTSKKNRVPLLGAAACLIYFLLVFLWAMPALRPANAYDQFYRFSYLGESWGDVINTLLTDPIKTAKVLFYKKDFGTLSEYKLGWWGLFLVSGGFTFVFYRRLIWVFIPLVYLKMLPFDPTMWGSGAHYSIEMVPLMILGSIQFASFLESKKVPVRGLLFLPASIGLFFYFNPYHKVHYNHAEVVKKRSKILPWSQTRFSAEGIDVQKVYEVLELIPPTASVTASSNLVPHLANRRKIFMFPNNLDSDYIALFKKNRGSYPLTNEERLEWIQQKKTDPDYMVVFESDTFILFKN